MNIDYLRIDIDQYEVSTNFLHVLDLMSAKKQQQLKCHLLEEDLKLSVDFEITILPKDKPTNQQTCLVHKNNFYCVDSIFNTISNVNM